MKANCQPVRPDSACLLNQVHLNSFSLPTTCKHQHIISTASPLPELRSMFAELAYSALLSRIWDHQKNSVLCYKAMRALFWIKQQMKHRFNPKSGSSFWSLDTTNNLQFSDISPPFQSQTARQRPPQRRGRGARIQRARSYVRTASTAIGSLRTVRPGSRRRRGGTTCT